MSSRRYRAYALVFESDVELPEFVPDDTTDGTAADDLAADVRIEICQVPDELDEVEGRGVLFQANRNAFLLKMPGIAKYLVLGGDTIRVEPDPQASAHEVRVFMLGSCIGALLHQRSLLVLHAAAFETDRGAVLLAGNSGAGKSTLLGEMLNRGYPMLVDDVCAVEPRGPGDLAVLSGYPRTRLWADAAARLEVDTQHLGRTRPTLEKFERQVPELFCDGSRRFAALYVLSQHNRPETSISRVPPVGAFGEVLRQTYRGVFMDGLAMRAPHFALATSVAQTVPVSSVVRPNNGFHAPRLADMILDDLR